MKVPGFLLNQTAEIEEYEGEDMYGPTYGDPYNVKCRAEFGHEMVRNQDGDEVVATVTFFFPPDVQPPPDSKITFDGDEFDVIEAKKQFGLRKPSHTEVVAK